MLTLIILCSIGSGNAWGAATLPVDYTFGGDSYPTGCSGYSLSLQGYAAAHDPYRLQFNATGDYLLIQTDAAAQQIIFGIKKIGGAGNSTFTVQGSTDGSSYTDIQSFSITGSQNAVVNCTTNVAIDKSYRYFKFYFTKSANVGFGTLKISKASSCEDPSTALTVSASSSTIYVDGTSTLSVGLSGNGSAVTYSVTSDNDDYASIVGTTFSATRAGTYTVEASQEDDGGICGGSDDIDITVRYQVKWSVNGDDSYSAGSPTSYIEEHNTKVTTLPTAPGTALCDGSKVFVGWTTTPIVGTTNTRPTDLFATAANSPAITTNTTFYAVFANKFAKATSTSNLADGASIVVCHVYNSQVLQSNGSTISTASAPIEDGDGKISPSAEMIWKLESNSSNWKLKSGSTNYLKGDANPTSSNKTKTISMGTSGNLTWVIGTSSYADNAFYIRNSSGVNAGLEYYSGWKLYYGTADNIASQYQYGMYLYVSTTPAYATTCCNQLAAPTNPGETPNASGAVLTWDAVVGATGYEVNIDDGGWASTGNGTTCNYTVTGKACGGTSVSWQVRATGDGSTNCAKGAATTARNFTTTACACTNQYTYFWGTQITNDNPSSSAYASHHFECFNTWNSTEGKTGLITLPNSDTENYWFVGYNGYYYNSNLPGGGRSWCTAIYDMNYANSQSDGKVLGWNSTAYPRGATGYIRIYSDNTNSNKYAAFIPSGYILRWKNNRNSDAWTSYPFTDTGASNYWETDLVQLGADLSSDKVWVGLPTSGMSESFTWCGKSEEKNLIGVGKKTGASTWAANGIVAGDANQWGKWRIEVTNNATNWNVHFVPYWKATYDVNGGGAISPTATNEGPVSCEGDATARQVTMPAAPTYAHHDFGGWKSSADNSINAAGATVSLTQNTTFTAQWTNSQYNITATLTNVTSETSFPVAYTYTGSAANVTYTFAAASGYRLPDNVTVTGSTYTWDQATGQLTLTGIITGAVSITVTAVQTHTIHWLVNGVDYTGKSPVTVDHGSSLTFPTPNPSAQGACDSKTFVGWTSASEITTETNTAPTLISEGTAVNGDATYRAVFADVTGYPDKFKRVTQLSDISEGSQIAIGFYVTSDIKLCGLDFNGWTTYSCATGVTEDGNSRIDKPSAANTWNVSKSGNYWVFTNAGDGSTKMGIGTTSSNNPLDPASTTYYKWEIGANSSGTNHFYLRLYDGSAMTYCALELYQSTWKIFDVTSSGNHVYASSAYTALKLYVPAGTRTNYITQCSSCTTPSSVTASDVTNNSATISWSGVSQTQQVGGSGTGFTVLWGTDATRANNNNTANVAAGTTTYNLTGLSEGTHYYVWVQSKCDDSWCATPADFTTLVSHTATFYDVDGTTPLQSGSVVEGSAITYSGSTPVSCDAGVDASTTFVGWASAPWSGKLAKGSIPSTFYDIAGGESLPNMGNSNMSFYPVFAKATGDPLTENTYTGDFSSKKFSSSNNTSATVNGISWTLDAYHYDNEWNQVFCTDFSTGNNSRGQKVGSSSNWPAYMSLTTSGISGTITSVAVSTAGNSGVNATVAVSVGSSGWKLKNTNNYSAPLTNSNTAYEFTGSGTGSISIDWAEAEENYTDALYFSQVVVKYTTGGDISYSNYMTSCATCVTPTSVAASDVTESGATITWSGTSASGTEGFKVAWNTANSVPSPLNASNSADVAKNVKTYDITGLNDGTTYYVFVQSKCNSEWSSSTNFTTLAIHDITFTKDNGTLSVVSPVGVVHGQTLTFPNVTSTSCGTFVGWKVTEVSDYDNAVAPSPLYKYNGTKENITADESYQAVYRTASGAETNVTDNVTIGVTGVTGNYADFSDATATSAAAYAGNVKKDDTRIQLRNSSNSGIVTTTSGGLAKKVTFNWAGSNTSGRIVDIYGKNTAYSSAADLYSADENVQGTKIGSITYGTSTELTISTDYNYIGIRAKDGAAYASSIDIIWYGSPMHYMTSPTCNPMVGITESLSSFTYVYGAGPSASQSFTVSGSNLTNNVTVAAPANYEVCLTAAGTYGSSVSIAQVAGEIDNTMVYIRLKEGLNVGSYNGGVVTVSSTGAIDATSAALTGSVTKAAATMAFTPDVYEATYEGSPVIVNFMLTLNGDGTVAYSRSPAAGSRAVNTDGENTFTALQAGIWTITATHTPGDNYTKAANATATVRVKCVDTYVDFIHNKAVLTYGSGTPVTDGKMEDWGSGYTVPYVADESEATSGSCQTTHFKFVGWVSEDEINIVEGTFKPGYTLISAGTAGKTASTKTYYAVWAKLED